MTTGSTFNASHFVRQTVRLVRLTNKIRSGDLPLEELDAALDEGKSIFNDLLGQRKAPDFDNDALRQARVDATVSNRETSEDLDDPRFNKVEGGTTEPPPVPPLPTGGFPYDRVQFKPPTSELTDAILFAKGASVGDRLFRQRLRPETWLVVRADQNPGNPAAFEFVRLVGE